MQKIKRFLFSKRFFTGLLALVQLAVFNALTVRFYTAGAWIYFLMIVFSVFVMLYLFEKDDLNPAYKIFWIINMVIYPVTGAVFYVLWGDTKMTRKQQRRMLRARENAQRNTAKSPQTIRQIETMDRGMGKQARYLENMGHAPAYSNTSARYYDTGATYFKDMLNDMKNARKSIFLQYFIIDEGYMWDNILRVLKRKAAEGLDIRLIYDGWGCMLNLPQDYEKQLNRWGIKTHIFNDVKFSVHIGDYLMLNHRDHRKITVIDSTIGYSGGINLADEYINVIERFGVWKDTGFRIEGEAVWGLTTTFMQTWEFISGERVSYHKFRPDYSAQSDGFVQPYFDTPLDRINVCENTYLSVINNAKDYVYIATPYLILDNEMLTAFIIAAGSGVDVRIVVPGIPDKWYVYYVTQSYYKTLVKAGVKIYEYTPGFVHAKMYVSDDMQAIVGGANTDYRSMYLNFENCCSFYGGSMSGRVKRDFEEMFSHSHLVTRQDVEKTPLIKRIMQIVFRVLSPMM